MSQLSILPDVDLEYCDLSVDFLPADDELPGEPAPALVASMKQHGYIRELGPVALSRLPQGGYRVIDGRRRIKTARKLRIDPIPVCISPDGAIFDPIILAATANNARSANPLTDLEAILKLAKTHDDKAIARELSLPVQVVRRRLKLASLDRELFDAMFGGYIKISIAERIAGLSGQAQAHLRDTLRAQGKVTGKDVDKVSRVQVGEAIAQLALPEMEAAAPSLPIAVAVNGGRPVVPFTNPAQAARFMETAEGYTLYRLVPCAPQDFLKGN